MDTHLLKRYNEKLRNFSYKCKVKPKSEAFKNKGPQFREIWISDLG
jgi:hypothetical protein